MNNCIIGIFLMITVVSYGQENSAIQNTLEQIINHAEEASLYRNKVDWDTLKPAIHELAKDAETVADLEPALSYMLKSLGDEHGRVFHNNQILAYYHNRTPKAHLAPIRPDIYNNIQMGQVYPFHAEMLKDNIGYIRIVGLPMGDNEKMAYEIQKEVCRLLKEGAEKWVVDLRYNGGGNMHPMAEGIALIIGNGEVGGSKGLTENESSIWRVENNNFYYDDFSIELTDSCDTDDNSKVAVLTSSYTASSGEALAVIFKGRDNTKFFGQKTLGMITVTDWHIINESTAMTISVSYYKDRNQVIYDKYVGVDVEMPFVEEPMSLSDECFNTAIEWLEEK
ncbi:MAG: hypothetical protein KDC34_01640 [Saprospiraceae bacterium]|nr:hypothetical protein [Saprospiraceae bacterium]